MDYINYHVEVMPDEQWVRITARYPDGAEPGRPRGRFGLAQVRVEMVALALAAARETASRQNIERLGEALFGALFFDPAVGEHFRSTFRTARDRKQGLRFELDFDEAHTPEVAALPWEFIRAPQTPDYPGFLLATDPNLVLSRRRSLWEPPRRAVKSGPWRILLAVAAPNDPKLGPVLYEPVVNWLRALAEQPDAKFHQLADPILDADSVKLDEALRSEPDILHFIGHGRFVEGPDDPHGELAMVGPGGWTEWLRDEDFGSLLERHVPAVVILQACEGGALSSGRGLTGVASKVVQHNVPVVVAMQYPISNAAALVFARKFYERLAAGDPVDPAAQEGRRALWVEYPGRREFATPVLFMRAPDGRVFDVERVSDKKPQRIRSAEKKRILDRAALRATLGLLVVLGLGVLAWLIFLVPPEPDDSVQVGIASFIGCPKVATDLSNEINLEPGEATTKTLPEITDSTAARANSNLDLVIWGKCDEANELTMYLEILRLNGPDEVIKLERVTAQTSNLDLDRATRLSRAVISYLNGDYEEAADRLASLQQEASAPSEQAELAFLRANSLLFMERYEEAIEVYEVELGDGAIRAQAYHNRGVAGVNWAEQRGRAVPAQEHDEVLQRAIDDLTTALTMAADTRVEILAHLNRATARYFVTGEYDADQAEKAVADCENALKLDDEEPLGYVCRAAARSRLIEEIFCPLPDTTLIRNDLAEAQRLDSNLADVFYWRGSLAELQATCDTVEQVKKEHIQESDTEFGEFLELVGQRPILLAIDRVMIDLTPASLSETQHP